MFQPAIIANDDHYTTIQETRLDVAAPGILENDTDSVEMAVAFHEESSNFRGKVKVYQDGKIRYDPPKGTWVGTDTFTYQACHIVDGVITEVCDSATVTIDVIVDPNRPAENPRAVDDTYTATEGIKLKIDSPGVLNNDNHESGKAIILDKRTKSPKGSIKTNKDGSFEYTAPSCFVGTDIWEYRVCYEDYKDMCDEATVTMEVQRDSNRPNPPRPQDDKYTVKEGESLLVSQTTSVLANDRPDKGEQLYVYDYKKLTGFEGTLSVRSDGRVGYTPAPGKRGSFYFSYTACYSDWSCVECQDAMAEIVVEADPSSGGDNGGDSGSRRGVATAYMVHWGASDEQQSDCEAVEPRLKLRCEGEGELSLLDLTGGHNSNCVMEDGALSCLPINRGHVYVECRDGRANNNALRQLIADVQASPVACNTTTDKFHLSWTYQMAGIYTYCDRNWDNKGIQCSHALKNMTDGATVCYGDDVSSGTELKPANITVRSANFEQCIYSS